jgi:uncharacterized membrane protein
LYNLSLYYIFFVAIVISDILFLLSATNLVSIALPGPYTYVWIMAFFLFLFEITLAISFDEEESMKNIFIVLLSYFSYCQLWIYIVVKAIYSEYIKKEKHTWDKTVRFDVKKTESTSEKGVKNEETVSH